MYAISTSQNKQDQIFYLSLIIFAILPILSLPLILRGIYHRDKRFYLLMSLFLGLMAILNPPTGDFYRYSQIFDAIADFPDIKSIIFFRDERSFDFLLQIICYSISRVGLTFEYVKAIYVFFCSYLLFRMHDDICNTNETLSRNKNVCFGFFFSLLMLSNFGQAFIFRWFSSLLIFVYGVFLIDLKKNKNGYIFLILSLINHWGMLLMALFYALQKIKHVHFNRTTLWIFFVLTFFQVLTILNTIVDSLGIGVFQEYLKGYTEGYWANEFMKERSFKGLVVEYFNQAVFWLVYFYFIEETKDKQAHSFRSFCHTTILVVLLVSSSFMAVGRYSAFLKYAGILYFFLNYDNHWKKFFKYFVVVSVMMLFMFAYGNRRSYIYGYSDKIFYSTFYEILTTKYPSSWAERNLTQDGNEYIND